jgi:hypothetical protein
VSEAGHQVIGSQILVGPSVISADEFSYMHFDNLPALKILEEFAASYWYIWLLIHSCDEVHMVNDRRMGQMVMMEPGKFWKIKKLK